MPNSSIKGQTEKHRFKVGDTVWPVNVLDEDGTIFMEWQFGPKTETFTVLEILNEANSRGYDILRIKINGSLAEFSEEWFVPVEVTPTRHTFTVGQAVLPRDFVRTDGSLSKWTYSPKDEYLIVLGIEDQKNSYGDQLLRIRLKGYVSTFSSAWFVPVEGVYPKPHPATWIPEGQYKYENAGSLSESYEDGYNPITGEWPDTGSLTDGALAATTEHSISVLDEIKEFAEWKRQKEATSKTATAEYFTGRRFRGTE